MVKNQIAFYSVPLGTHPQPYNLHGFANGTGGKVVRLGILADEKQWVARISSTPWLKPILYDSKIKLPAEVAEAFPTKLPPLRPDVPTLVVGKLGKTGATLRLQPDRQGGRQSSVACRSPRRCRSRRSRITSSSTWSSSGGVRRIGRP